MYLFTGTRLPRNTRFFAAALCVSALLAPRLFAGPLQRVPNTTLQMPTNPPVFGYTSENAFGTLTFSNAVGMATPPGETNRLFVIEKNGRIAVITNLAAPTRTIFLDITDRVTSTAGNGGSSGEQGLLGLAFHPGYATNRYFYVFYTGEATSSSSGLHDILSRFQTSVGNSNLAASATELRLFAQRDQQANHNGGDIQFGPDGYLYIPLGDEGGGSDNQNNSQMITNDFFSGIFRIDVDKRATNLPPQAHASLLGQTNYHVPADNPFVGATTFNGQNINPNLVRTEFWATGLRNPWRMSFDSQTGALYVGDVGQDSGSGWEEINIIVKGGNYGWAYIHGTLTGPKSAQTPPGFSQIAPLFAYQTGSQNNSRAIMGGVMYRGNRLSQLTDHYVYGDYVSGNIWALRHSGTTIITNQLLFVDTGVCAFGIDPSNGDVLYADLATPSIIKRIKYDNTPTGTPLPPTLADTGAFTNLTTLTPHAGIVPYDINVPFWSDNAIKSRWFSVPNTNLVMGFNPSGNWSFPTGSVWIKHFDLELTNGVPASRKRLETRFLVRNLNGIYGATYRWDSPTNATLVPEGGLDEAFVVNDGGGILRTQIWRYPSRADCLTCHTHAGGLALGFNTQQLNHDYNYSGDITNQLIALSEAGYLNTSITNVDGFIALAHATNTAAPLEHRARSYFDANCVQCHQPAGTVTLANWDARVTTPTALAGLINAIPLNNLGDTNNRVIKPLAPANSTLFKRVAEFGPFHMPPLATSVTNVQALDLLEEWIMSLTNSFWIGATPESQTALPGDDSNFPVSILATDDFTETITLIVTGLPPGATAGFTPPTVNGSGASTLTVSTLASTPVGAYPLTISGIGGGQTNTDTVTLVVSSNLPPVPGVLHWTGASGSGINWSTALNWTNVTASTNSVPGFVNSVLFTNTAAVASAGTTNNVVNSDLGIGSLQFANNAASGSPLYHVTHIANGRTLTVSNNTSGNTVYISSGVDSGANQVVHSVIGGNGGRWVVQNANGNFNIRQGGSAGTHRATLDLTDLGTFEATVGRLLLGGDGDNTGAGSRLSAVMYLARTNVIVTSGAAPQINMGDHPSNGRGSPPIVMLPTLLFLGQTNAIFTDSITVGRQKAAPVSLLFNPAFTANNPTALFRGTGGLNSRISLWAVGDNLPLGGSNQSTEGTNDFTGGAVDALIDVLRLGTSCNGNNVGSGTGIVLFAQGTIDANTIQLGYQTFSSGAFGVGTLDVNNTAQLVVNTDLLMARLVGGAGGAFGTLNVSGGGTVTFKGTVSSGGGTSIINLTNGVLNLTNTIGTPSARITSLSAVNSTFNLRVNGSSAITNISVTTLNAGGVNTIVIGSALNVTGITDFPLFSYGTLNGSLANFKLGGVPAGYSATLLHNAAANRLDLRIAPAALVTPRISNIALSGSNVFVEGTNGLPEGGYYVLTTTNLTLPLSNWTFIATNLFDPIGQFSFTNSVAPDQAQQFYLLQLQ